MPATTRTTQETAPCGGPTALPFLPRAGLNLPISAMVASVNETPRLFTPAGGARRVWRKARTRRSIAGDARRLEEDVIARCSRLGRSRSCAAEQRGSNPGGGLCRPWKLGNAGLRAFRISSRARYRATMARIGGYGVLLGAAVVCGHPVARGGSESAPAVHVGARETD